MSAFVDDSAPVRVRRYVDPSQNSMLLRQKRFSDINVDNADAAVLSFLKDDTNFLPPQRGEGVA